MEEDNCKGTKGKGKNDILALDNLEILAMGELLGGVVAIDECMDKVGR